MARLDDLTGKEIGAVKVIKRVEDFDGESDSRSQYLVHCSKCEKESKVVGRNLKRYKTRYNNGCNHCYIKKNKSGFRYGRNVNGFIDKSIIIENDG